MFAVFGLCFTDFRPVAFSCKQRFQLIDAPDKAIKQSRDLKYVLFLLISDLCCGHTADIMENIKD